MSAADAHFFGGVALFVVWLAINLFTWVWADDDARPLALWAALNLAGLAAFGVWGVTR